jgi:hypothetical protein
MILDDFEECPFCTCDGDMHDQSGCLIHPSCPHTSECADFEYLAAEGFDDDEDFDDFPDNDLYGYDQDLD